MSEPDLDMHDGHGPGDEDEDEQEEAPRNLNIQTEEELEEKFPNRPHNHSDTLPFHDLYLDLFNPLHENKKRPAGFNQARRRQQKKPNPHDTRKHIIDKFIIKWRERVGNDIFPAFRLIVPEKDRDRPMYGLKEKTIAKILVKVVQVDPASEAGHNLLNWKLPGVQSASHMAGDFAGRCYEVISSRSMKTDPGNLTIQEVNDMLDRLSIASKEDKQLPIFREFYNKMNADEMMWLIRIILRHMKVGASEKTLFDAWHPDAENLFNVSSSLRRVCWELHDRDIKLDGNDTGITLMQCFQPQLAQFQTRSIEKMVAKMHATEEDPYFWIEEKLDGERMQMHVMEDENIPGGMRFAFWSRKAKNYTSLYGQGFEDSESSLTRFIKGAFHPDVRNLILDGEMMNWDPVTEKMVAFGHLKTSAIGVINDPHAKGNRPLFRVFDCLYLNDQVLTSFPLRDRRKALVTAVVNVDKRLEIHEYIEATSADEVDPLLRKVVAESSEGLVLKNPRSVYRLNDRNEDWMKVKPEYMTEFGEELDCVVIGGYYGSGHRGGNLSSFLCGLRLDSPMITKGVNPEKTYSFFKVGGGLTAQDYAEIRHMTDGKWEDWDPKKPPTSWIELAGGERQLERPDVWIKPHDSVVISVKAASVIKVNTFRTGNTLRFPRFKALRRDKDWTQTLTLEEFRSLNSRAEHEKEEKKFKIDEARKKRVKKARKKVITVIGADEEVKTPYAGPKTALFNGIAFYIITGAAKPINKSKSELEQLVKANDGRIVATHTDPDTICIAEGNPVRVASIKKSGTRNIIRPSWLLESVAQAECDRGRPSMLLPYETRHVLYSRPEDANIFASNVDEYGDSFARDVEPGELEDILAAMKTPNDEDYDADDLMNELIDDEDMNGPGFMFYGLRICMVGRMPDLDMQAFRRIVLFAGANLADALDDEDVTHVVVEEADEAVDIRRRMSSRKVQPRIVTTEWILECFRSGTRVDEERYAPF